MTCPVQQRLCLYFPLHCTGARFLHRFINADATVRAERLGVGKRFVLLFYAYAYIHTHTYICICLVCMYTYIHTHLQYCMGWKPAAGASVQAMRTSSLCYGGITLQASMFCAR